MFTHSRWPVATRALAFAMMLSATTAIAEEADSPTSTAGEKISRRLTVTANAVDEVPGSAHVLEGEELDRLQVGADDIHRILRHVPGVNIQEEDGYGLRPNIGLRGVPNERSSKITLMEDGILMAPAPYAAPSAYYFPPAGRMQGVEVTKGASQIKYGPYTTGGSLNLLSTQIPEVEEDVKAYGKFSAGEDNLKKFHGYVGQAWTYGGVLVETYQLETDGFKELDGGGATGVDIEDFQAKFRLNTGPETDYYQEIQYALGFYDQFSNETYIGLTDEDFGSTPFRRYAGTQLDNIDADHQQHSIRHFMELPGGFDLTTVGYYHSTQRNWQKVDVVGGSSTGSIFDDPMSFADELAWIKGADSPDDSFSLRFNNRKYHAKGVQSVLGAELEALGAEHEVEIGARFHSDEEDRFQKDDLYRMDSGTLVRTTEGAPGSNANREGKADAWAFFIQDKIEIDKLTLTPGVRYERINYTRKDWGRSDPQRTGVSLKRNDTDVDAFIPGIGGRYQFTEEFAGFVGVHKGFSPPGPSSNDEVEEEESIAYETGVDYRDGAFASEVVLFYSDYDNLLGADTLSSGGAGTGDLFNAGEVSVMGVEASVGYDFGAPFEAPFAVPFKLTYTYTDAEFEETFDSDFFGAVEKGDQLTYVPEHQLAATLGIERGPLALSFDAHFVDKMRTAPEQSGVSTDIFTDSYLVFDALLSYELKDGVKVFGAIENIGDREYVVARRPAGARPGLPQTLLAGVEFAL